MPLKREPHPSGTTEITFNDRWHIYKSTAHPKKKFTSGTKFLGRFFGKFDADKISKAYGKKHDMDPAAVRAMWSRKGEIGRETGTIVHKYLEDRLLGIKTTHLQAIMSHPDPEIQDAVRLKLIQADSMLEEFNEKYKFIRAEMIVASLKHDVAGTIDVLCRNKDTGNICFADFKTNKKIDYSNSWQSGLSVLKHMDDCSYNKYRIQLGLYQYIAVEEGYITPEESVDIERVIIHIRDDGYSFIQCRGVTAEISQMLAA